MCVAHNVMKGTASVCFLFISVCVCVRESDISDCLCIYGDAGSRTGQDVSGRWRGQTDGHTETHLWQWQQACKPLCLWHSLNQRDNV